VETIVMEYIIAICGFVGGWLLVAGPLWQASIELREEEFDREAIQAAQSTVVQPEKISGWWWLLPPVAYVLQVRRQRAARKAFQDALPPEQLKQTVSFMNKANGWLIVATGGFLLAVKETWELVNDIHFPQWVFWVLVVVMPIVAIANSAVRMVSTQKLLEPDSMPRPRPRRQTRN
jgi:hypothetical protein